MATENVVKEDPHGSPSYVKLAKQFITTVKQTTQKLMHADPANCQTVSGKIAAVAD